MKPYLPHVTKSELHAIMTAGFSTIAGSVLGAYISFGVSNTNKGQIPALFLAIPYFDKISLSPPVVSIQKY